MQNAPLPICDWVYFARHIERGDKILLAYGGKGRPYAALFCCTVVGAPNPVRAKHSFDAFTYIDESFSADLLQSHYTPDPVLGRFVGIAIGEPQDLRPLVSSVPRPEGNNTLWRWAEVFG